MGKTDVGAALAAGLTGAVTIFLYLTISLPLFFHVSPYALYTWDASNVLGYQIASRAPLATVIAVGQGMHLVVSLIWGFVFVLVARTLLPQMLARPPAWGFAFGFFVMMVMRFGVVPLGHAPQNPYTPLGFTNTFVAHTLFFGVPVAWAASRLMRPRPSTRRLRSGS